MIGSMSERHAAGHWARFNAGQTTREPRGQCRRAMALAGPGAGRTAIDLGCGGGRETRALLDAGWRVTAVDSEPGTEVRALFDGLEIEHWHEEDAPGEAYSGPKHWHVFEVIACLR